MTNVPYHMETSQLICIGNQLTGFYMMEEIGCYVWQLTDFKVNVDVIPKK